MIELPLKLMFITRMLIFYVQGFKVITEPLQLVTQRGSKCPNVDKV